MLEKYVLQDISFPFINVRHVSFKLHCQEIVCWALNIWPWFKPFSAPSPIHPLQKIFACQNVCLSKYLCFLLSIWYQMHNLPFVTLDLEKFKHIACWKVTTEKTQHKINVSTTRLPEGVVSMLSDFVRFPTAIYISDWSLRVIWN